MAGLIRTTQSDTTDALLFLQEEMCGVMEWTPLSPGAVAGCQPAPIIYDDEAPSVDDAADNSTKTQAAVVDEDVVALRTEHDGIFLSMSLGGVEDTSAKGLYKSKDEALASNYLYFQARVSVLSFTVVVDISVKAGKASEGGGIMMYFKFEWALGSLLLAELEGNLDLVPLDLEVGVRNRL